MSKFVNIRKSSMFLLCVVLFACSISGCSASNSGGYINKEYKESGLLTIDKNAYDYEIGIISGDIGVGIQLTQDMESMAGKITPLGTEFGINLLYVAEKALAALNSDLSSDERNIEMNKGLFLYAAVMCIPDDNDAAEGELEHIRSNYSKLDVLAKSGGYTYYFAYNEDYSQFTLTDNEKSDLDKLFSNQKEFKSGVCLFPPVIKAMPASINMNDFGVETLDGTAFTQKELADYDITMVNIWATWCGPCVEEMPHLQELYGKLPDNVNLITICADANEELELAKKITQETGCTFITLIPDKKLEESLLSKVEGYPTTIFVDKDGNLIGSPQLGVPGGKGNIVEAYMKLINEQLDKLVSGK